MINNTQHPNLPRRIALAVSAVAATAALGGTLLVPQASAAPVSQPRSTTVKAGVSTNAIVNLGLTRAEARNVQRSLIDCGYQGAIDGLLGPQSWKAMQTCLRPWGYKGAIDGIVGGGTVSALQRLLKANGFYSGAIDGIAGPQTKAGFKKFSYWI
ncbi:MAG TPA: peptidoglycan-binding domain-containing protein [Microlunatus sp.]